VWAATAAGGLVSVLAVVGAPVVIPAIFGTEYSDAVIVAQILAVTFPFSFGNSVLLRALFARGRERQVPRVLAEAALINLCGNLIAINLYGIYGAAVMTILTEVFLRVRMTRCASPARFT
jgi:O-antigen/teichoic acid export membrane protein